MIVKARMKSNSDADLELKKIGVAAPASKRAGTGAALCTKPLLV